MGALTQIVLRRLGLAFLSPFGVVACGCAIVATAAMTGQAGATDAFGVEKRPLPPLTAPTAPAAQLNVPTVGILEEALALVLKAYVSAPLKDFRTAGDRDDVIGANDFYLAQGFKPLWVSQTGYTPKAVSLIGTLQQADAWGLKSSDFVVPALAAPIGRQALIDAELAMTRAVLRYARHARGGRIADPGSELSGFIDRKPQLLAPHNVLTKLVDAQAAETALQGLHPQHVEFDRLRLAYNKARETAKDSAAKTLPAGPLLKPGMTHANVATLRLRLNVPVPAASSDNPTPSADYFDDGLTAAVKQFQVQAKLRQADGMVGEKTRLSLNADRATASPATLLANMEQWRWMPEQLGDTHILVNVPEFTTRIIKGGKVAHSERVVTGKTATATPLFSDEMQTVVFQPNWIIPDSIKVNELLPQLQAGNGLRDDLRMTFNGRDVDPWDIDWSKADITHYNVYQPSGDSNALGVVKFLFPNKHAVYMHDTPSKKLFNSEVRAFSHGCVRVRNPLQLAEQLLAADKGWNAKKIRELAWDGPENNIVKLDTPVPVHIAYFTASVDETGNISTFGDVYGHEKRITLALEGKHSLIAKLDPPPLPVATASRTQVAKAAVRPGRNFPAARPAEGQAAVVARPVASLPPPQALGYSQNNKQWSWTPQPSVRRYQGNTSNDLIMRQLNGN
jgi:L,D-transpeptidase YcbB